MGHIEIILTTDLIVGDYKVACHTQWQGYSSAFLTYQKALYFNILYSLGVT